MPGLLQRLEECLALLLVIDHVVLGAPGEKKGRAIVLGRDMGQRRSVEVDAPVVDEAHPEKFLDDLVARTRDLVVAPLPREVEHRVDRYAGLDGGRDAAVRVGGVAFPEQRVLPRERDQRREVPARGIAHERSEEHTSELQSLRHLVCRLLLEKKKKRRSEHYYTDL